MIPGKSDAPCFTTVEEAAEDTFGNAVIAQVDDDTGKTCLKQVPLEDTSDAYLAGRRPRGRRGLKRRPPASDALITGRRPRGRRGLKHL